MHNLRNLVSHVVNCYAVTQASGLAETALQSVRKPGRLRYPMVTQASGLAETALQSVRKPGRLRYPMVTQASGLAARCGLLLRRVALAASIVLSATAVVNAQEETALPDQAPGLLLTITAGNQTDVRISELAALHAKAGEAASPFVPPGAFSAEFAGLLNLESRSRLYFSLEGSGTAKLTIGEDVVFEASGNFSGESERIRLNKGAHPIRLAYQSPASGDAAVRLIWRGRDFDHESIPTAVLSHEAADAALAKQQLKRNGRALFGEHRCIACHEPSAKLTASAMPELSADAPSFVGIGDRLQADWIAHWLVKPSALRPSATMPALFGHGSVDEALKANDSRPWDVAAYLATLKDEKPAAAVAGDAVRGGVLFRDLGCIACHQSPEKTDAADPLQRIPLVPIRGKWQANALAAFLQQPGKHYAWGRMPDFGLSPQEAADLATLLLTTAPAPTATPEAPKGDVAAGKKLVTEMGCMNCHAGPDKSTFQAAKLTQLAGKNWLDNGCAAPADKVGSAPHFAFSDDERAALAAFGQTDLRSLERHAPAEFAERQFHRLNCIACHTVNNVGNVWNQVAHEADSLPGKAADTHVDQARPSLTWAGEKLNTDWMVKLFNGELADKPRPWLAARMPAFPTYATHMANGLAARHGLAPCTADAGATDADSATIGKRLLSPNGGFACVICHAVGSQKALAPFESVGTNLAHANERLRHDYYLRWMRDPIRIDPATKMPKFAMDNGKTALTDTLDGDADAQFQAIWEFLKEKNP